MRTNSFAAPVIAQQGGLIDSASNTLLQGFMAWLQSRDRQAAEDRQLARDERRMGREQLMDAYRMANEYGIRPTAEQTGWVGQDINPAIDQILQARAQRIADANAARDLEAQRARGAMALNQAQIENLRADNARANVEEARRWTGMLGEGVLNAGKLLMGGGGAGRSIENGWKPDQNGNFYRTESNGDLLIRSPDGKIQKLTADGQVTDVGDVPNPSAASAHAAAESPTSGLLGDGLMGTTADAAQAVAAANIIGRGSSAAVTAAKAPIDAMRAAIAAPSGARMAASVGSLGDAVTKAGSTLSHYPGTPVTGAASQVADKAAAMAREASVLGKLGNAGRVLGTAASKVSGPLSAVLGVADIASNAIRDDGRTVTGTPEMIAPVLGNAARAIGMMGPETAQVDPTARGVIDVWTKGGDVAASSLAGALLAELPPGVRLSPNASLALRQRFKIASNMDPAARAAEIQTLRSYLRDNLPALMQPVQ